SSPQFPWASPAEFTIWKQASGAGLEPEEAWAKPHWLPSPQQSPHLPWSRKQRTPEDGPGCSGSLTRPPELLALLLQCRTCAIPAVAPAAGTGRAVQEAASAAVPVGALGPRAQR
ncbi:unnamed protein product, partial [Gulo gulo]